MTRTPAAAVRGLWATLSERDDDGIVMYEHPETWTLASGEV